MITPFIIAGLFIIALVASDIPNMAHARKVRRSR